MPRMFRLPKYRDFNFQPRFYDQEREKFEKLRERRKHSEQDKDSKGEATKKAIREGFSRQSKSARLPEQSSKKYKYRVLVIFIVLTALFYFFFFA